jgi:hypothetical protein
MLVVCRGEFPRDWLGTIYMSCSVVLVLIFAFFIFGSQFVIKALIESAERIVRI